MPFDREWCGEARPDPGRERRCGRGITCVRLQYSELVAAETGDEIARSDALLESLGNLSEESIADCMAECIVNILEIVEIEKKDRERAGAAPTGGEDHLEPLQK